MRATRSYNEIPPNKKVEGVCVDCPNIVLWERARNIERARQRIIKLGQTIPLVTDQATLERRELGLRQKFGSYFTQNRIIAAITREIRREQTLQKERIAQNNGYTLETLRECTGATYSTTDMKLHCRLDYTPEPTHD